MKVYTDDELYRVDRTYLGPKGRRVPWRATYRAYGVWFMTTVVLGVITFKLFPITFYSVVFVLVGSLLFTIKAMDKLDTDRPLSVVPIVAWHELEAPRVTQRPARHVVDVKVPRHHAGADYRHRWWHRNPRPEGNGS